MTIWVDADSCPRVVRDIVQKASQRLSIPVEYVANKPIAGLIGPLSRFTLSSPEKDSADDLIAARAMPGDLAITRDIPLAARLIEKKVSVIDDRGLEYSEENIRERLSIRNFNISMALDGLGGPRTKTWGTRELNTFANTFDRCLTKLSSSG